MTSTQAAARGRNPNRGPQAPPGQPHMDRKTNSGSQPTEFLLVHHQKQPLQTKHLWYGVVGHSGKIAYTDHVKEENNRDNLHRAQIHTASTRTMCASPNAKGGGLPEGADVPSSSLEMGSMDPDTPASPAPTQIIYNRNCILTG